MLGWFFRSGQFSIQTFCFKELFFVIKVGVGDVTERSMHFTIRFCRFPQPNERLTTIKMAHGVFHCKKSQRLPLKLNSFVRGPFVYE